MRLLAPLLLVLGLSLQSSAEPPRPYIGGSFGMTTVNNNYLMQKNITGIDLPDHSGTDFQIELGAANDIYSAYIGYRAGSSSWDDGERIYHTYRGDTVGTNDIRTSDLKSAHIIIGGRFQPKLGLPKIIRPMIGLGLSRGTVDRDITYTPDFYYNIITENGVERSETYESDTEYGGLMEFGVALRPNAPFQIYLTYQIHAMMARYSTEQGSPVANQYEVREHAIQLGVIYTFKTLGKE